MEWTDDTIARIRDLWAEGLSTAEIGRRMGITKNAVVGKAHRLNLPPRPSPIRRGTAEGRARTRAPVKRAAATTLPALAASVPVAATSGPAQMQPTAAPPPIRPVVLRAVPAPRPAGRVAACCWPLGDPGTPSFRFCGEGAAPGKPYCAEHAAVAYVRVRDRREDAA